MEFELVYYDSTTQRLNRYKSIVFDRLVYMIPEDDITSAFDPNF